MSKRSDFNRVHPPRWADELLAWFCAPELLEELQGDLHEEFYYQLERLGEKRARRRYIWDVIGFIRPFAIRGRSKRVQATQFYTTPSTSLYPVDMFNNYLTIALRNLWRNKGYTAIHVVGLSVAFCLTLFLFLIAYMQLTYDSFHQDKDRIFQAYFFLNDPEKPHKAASMPMPLTPALKTEFPEVEAAARFMTIRKSLVEFNGKLLDKEVYLTDPDFLRLFSFPLLKGNPKTALTDLNSAIISESMAKQLFDKEDPMGKIVQIGSEGAKKGYVITGVTADPVNTAVRYEALIRIENHPDYRADQANWGANSHRVFVKLAAHTNHRAFENQLKSFTQKYFQRTIQDLKRKGARPDAQGDIFAVRLQPLLKIHFDRELSNGPPVAIVYAIFGIALFILGIACINFVNLSIARSLTRAREVGIRKTLGALKSQLFVQIWGESTGICAIGLLIGSLLAYLLLPEFNATFDARIKLNQVFQFGFIVLMACVFVLVTLVAGGYPAWLMARFNPVQVLKGKVSLKRPGALRNSLIVTQFVMASLLTCCTIIALQQLDYMRSKPMGFEKEQVISIPVGNQVNGRQALLRMRNKLATDPTVLAVTGTGVNIGRGKDRVTSRAVLGFTHKGNQFSSDWLLVDYDYLKTLNIPLVAGREFDPAYPSDSLDRVIITESMAKMIGEKNPVGTYFRNEADSSATKFQVIGVVPDFHLYSLRDELMPITMHLSHREEIHYIFVRVSPQSLKSAMDKLKKVWQEIAPQSAFQASFLDENVNEWYHEEESMSYVFSFASVIAILLSCLGLFAVALLISEQRTKEIGIRKVLGAGIPSIVLLLSKDFIKMVVIALAIAVPLAWFFMHQWLENYSYRIQITIWVFAGVALAAILITLITVSFQSIRTALMNPVKSLRAE